MRNRKPWKKLIKKFVDTFSSQEIRCNMGEKIDELEGHTRIPDAVGKDIFRVTKEKKALLDAVHKLHEADPNLGVKPLLAKLREKQLDLGAGKKEVQEALEAAKAKEKKKQEADEKKKEREDRRQEREHEREEIRQECKEFLMAHAKRVAEEGGPTQNASTADWND